MMDQAPQWGLTRDDTGMPHPLFEGWFLTQEYHDEIMVRVNHKHAMWLARPIAKKARRVETRLICQHCNRRFTRGNSRQKYCNDTCRKEAAKLRPRPIRKKREVPTAEKTCRGCGDVFMARWVNNRKDFAAFCSKSCSGRWWGRERKAA